MAFFSCFWMRRRLAAYFGGTLSVQQAGVVAAHLKGCAGCGQEASRLERLRKLVHATLAAGPDPDWSGFWGGVRRRILTESPRPWREAWWGGVWRQISWRPRLALGGALAGLLLMAAALWPRGPQETPMLPPTVVVTAVETAHPEGNLAVFSSPEDEMTVIWVFGLDQPADQSRIRPVGLSGEGRS